MLEMHPWQRGPSELIKHALEHLGKDSDFDHRMAFLLVDLGVETLFKTFLVLPSNVTGTKTSYHERRKAADGNFHDVVEGVKEAASLRLEGLDLSYIEFYHSLRNRLYHQGNGITISTENAIGYARCAADFLKALLGIDLTDSLVLNPEVQELLMHQARELQSALEDLAKVG